MEMRQIGDCTLYLGDCREVLATLGPVDATLTDPPYEKEAHTKGRRLLGKQRNGKRTVEFGALDFSEMTEELRQEVSDVIVQKCGKWFLCFCQAEAVAAWRDCHQQSGATYKRAMVWLKPDGPPQFTGDRPGMGYESIVASWCGKGRSVWNGGGRHGVFRHPQRDSNNPKQHMTQKPLALMLELVDLFTDPSDIVLDPFMGSGTTGVACAKMNRRFIGIEIDPVHFQTSCERIAAVYSQPDFFVASPAAMVQERML